MRVILTARHVHPNVNSEADYRQRQREHIARFAAKYPNLPPIQIRPAKSLPKAFISGGRLLVMCACGNAPAVEPLWHAMALCFECGAVYEGVTLPDDFGDIERVLVRRPVLATRNWTPPETVADLQTENAANGVTE